MAAKELFFAQTMHSKQTFFGRTFHAAPFTSSCMAKQIFAGKSVLLLHLDET